MDLKFKKRERLLVVALIVSMIIVCVSVAEAELGGYQTVGDVSFNAQYYQPGFFSSAGYTSPNVYWPEFDSKVCRERQDFIIQIAPGGCQPAVVRSDILEDQPVPVFCKLMVIQANPLIDISRVKSVRFPGKYPEGVTGISYFPSRINLNTQQNLVDTPIDDNAGYFVVQLKKYPSEKEMPDWIGGNLTAVIYYDIESALGIGKTSFYVSELDEAEWLSDYKFYGFWNGKGYIRADSIESDRVTVSVYRDPDSKQSSLTLKKGETSQIINLGGFYCAAGLKVTVEDIGAPVKRALLQVDDKQIWVAKDDRILDNACTVGNIVTYPGGGKVSMSCQVKNGRFDLVLNPNRVMLNVSETLEGLNEAQGESFGVGDEIKSGTGIYLGYLGSWNETKGETKFVVFISDPWSSNNIEFNDKKVFDIVDKVVNDKKITDFDALEKKIIEEIKKVYKTKVSDKTKQIDNLEFIFVLKEGEQTKIPGYSKQDDGTIKKTEKTYYINLPEIKLAENKNWEEDNEASSELLLAKEYYDNATKHYKNLVDLYPNEKVIEGEYFEPYAAEALFNAAGLARKFEMYGDEAEFLKRLYIDYLDSTWAGRAKSIGKNYNKYDFSESKVLVNLRTGGHFIDLLDVKGPSKADLSVDLLVGGETKNLGSNEIQDISNDKEHRSIQIDEIDEKYVKFTYFKSSKDSSDKSSSSNSIILDLERNLEKDLDGTRVKLVNINLKKSAKLVLDSDVKGPTAYSNFSFKIGIEKRGIKLSTEKTKEMIENIDKSIKEWESVNEKLGKVVKGMKGACFATSAVLMAKNLFEGFGGKSMARSEVMTKTWNNYCEGEVSAGKFVSVEKCLLDHNSDIEKDIEIYAKRIEETNKKLEAARGTVVKTDILDFDGQVADRAKMEENFRDQIKAECATWRDIELPPSENGVVKTLDTADFCNWGSFEDMKEISTLYNTWQDKGSGVLESGIKRDLARAALNAQNYHDDVLARAKADEEAKTKGLGIRETVLVNDKVTYASITTLSSADKSGAFAGFSELRKGDKVIRVFIPPIKSFGQATFEAKSEVAGKDVIVKIKESQSRGTYVFDKAYTLDGGTDDGSQDISITKDVQNYLSLSGAQKFQESDAKAYENKIISPDKLKRLQVKYFDRVPYKGLPAEVPFDVENGWYVELEYVLSGFGKPYDESGRPVNFYICNVGKNNLIEFKRGDDICRYYNGVSDELGFPGLDAGKSRELVNRAKQALYDAVKYYGKKTAIINGKEFDTGISFGGEAGRCSDFMSPSDCNIMFNLCDPVICPSSRCDLGGKFPVDNVIQTGIIGSLVLCLPNIQEGIYIPICLSGVHAGIEGFVSILKAERECLNESLTTGRNIGICDEVTSIYKCEFFWRQLVPFADVIIPKIVESFFSQGVRGGGEYLTVQSAWDNTQGAIDYFKNEYAVNSMNAFNLRSTEEAGSEICKSFISARYPTNFDLLTEPDSPVQYTAWFDENILTTATPYPTSHYKVYYHIYAGKDYGTYYIVYLKEISQEFASNYIYTGDTYVVDRNYIPKGGHVDKAKDFTAPSGYKKLCINVNGQENCDFGKVSTSFAINYISDKYAEEQAKEQIITSKNCVAGTPSLYSLAQPNLQAGAEEALEPELYNQGIVRVCSTYNPGKQVDAKGEYDTTNSTYDRWKDVGYCDDTSLRCWLDTDSVKEVIKNKELETGVLNKVDTSSISKMDYLTPENSKEITRKAERFISSLSKEKLDEKTKGAIDSEIKDIVVELNQLANLGSTNAYRARGLLLLGNLYGKVAGIIKGEDTSKKPNTEDKQGVVETTTVSAGDRTTTQPAGTKNEVDLSQLREGYVLVDEGGKEFKITSDPLEKSNNNVLVIVRNTQTSSLSPIVGAGDTSISELGYTLSSDSSGNKISTSTQNNPSATSVNTAETITKELIDAEKFAVGSDLWEKAEQGQLEGAGKTAGEWEEYANNVDSTRTEFFNTLSDQVLQEIENVPLVVSNSGTFALISVGFKIIICLGLVQDSYTNLVHEYTHVIYRFFVSEDSRNGATLPIKRQLIDPVKFKEAVIRYYMDPNQNPRLGSHNPADVITRDSFLEEYKNDLEHLFVFTFEDYYLDRTHPTTPPRIPDYLGVYFQPFFS